MEKKKTIKITGFVLIFSFFAWNAYHQLTGTGHSLPGRTVSPVSNPDKDRVPWRENYAWSQLQDLITSCKTYWALPDSDGLCTLETVSQSPFFFRHRPVDRPADEGRVEVVLISGKESTFYATARHEKSNIIWSINAEGKTTCSLGFDDACRNATHFSQEEIMQEVHHAFGDDVPNDVTSIEIKGTQEDPYVEFERGPR